MYICTCIQYLGRFALLVNLAIGLVTFSQKKLEFVMKTNPPMNVI